VHVSPYFHLHFSYGDFHDFPWMRLLARHDSTGSSGGEVIQPNRLGIDTDAEEAVGLLP
jgi:hypothetical protein